MTFTRLRSMGNGARFECLLLALGLVTLTAAVYWPVHSFSFLSFDDQAYVTENVHVKAGLNRETAAWASTAIVAGNWHPLTVLSHMLDVWLFGVVPGPPHVVNAVLHALNCLLLFAFLQRVTGAAWRSAVVAALFAVHPLHVESVAWIAERKDVLSTFFWMLTLSAYAEYVRRSSGRWYGIALLAYLGGLLAKPMVVTLPFVLLLLDVWPLRRCVAGRWPRALLIEKVPLLLLSAVLSVITYRVQATADAVVSLADLPFSRRVGNAVIWYVEYLQKTVWPAKLAVYYPFYPLPPALPAWQLCVVVIVLAGMSLCVIWQARRRAYLFTGWFWYVGTLVPVIGLVKAGGQGMADRFMYIPSVGLFIIVAWGVPDLLAAVKYGRVVCSILAAAAIAACTLQTTRQLSLWRDDVPLLEHALAVTQDNFRVHSILAVSLMRQGRSDAAAPHFQEVVRICAQQPVEPFYSYAHFNLGDIMAARGEIEPAMQHYREGLRIDPSNALAHAALARLLARSGDRDGALAEYREAIRLQPDAPVARNNFATLLVEMQRDDEAVAQLQEALRAKPDYAEAYFNLGTLFLQRGQRDEAKQNLMAAVQHRPDYAEAHDNLGYLLFDEGDTAAAIAEYRRALQLREDFPEAHTNLGTALAADGKLADAVAEFEAALRYKPDHVAAHRGLGLALAQLGQRDRAVAELEAALALDPADAQTRQQLERLRTSR